MVYRKAIRRSGLETNTSALPQPAAWIADKPSFNLLAQDSTALIFVSFHQGKERSLAGQVINAPCYL
jgi:hypothetical protein